MIFGFPILGIVGIIAAAVVILLFLLIGYSAKVSSEDLKKKKAEGKVPSEDDAELLRTGREKLMHLRRLMLQIKNAGVRGSGNEVCGVIDRILQTLKERPDRIKRMRQFFNYYLPTISEVISRYQRMEGGNVPMEEMTEKVLSYLTDVKAVLEKQYENLFKEDTLDMEVDMEAMTRTARRDGLLTGEAQEEEPEKKEESIQLTL